MRRYSVFLTKREHLNSRHVDCDDTLGILPPLKSAIYNPTSYDIFLSSGFISDAVTQAKLAEGAHYNSYSASPIYRSPLQASRC
jgi:hypothetical protein